MHNSNINIALDVLEGCGYTCSGCTVDRDMAMLGMTQDDIENLLTLGFGIVGAHDDTKHELTIGPTDFISSNNGPDVLKHPMIQKLLTKFNVINIPLSLLSPKGLVEFAQLFNEYAPGKMLRIAIPVTIKNALKPKYIDLLRRHIQIIKDNLVECNLDRIYITISLMGSDIDLVTVENLHALSEIEFPVRQTREFFFGHSRANFDCLVKQSEFIRDYRKYTAFMSSIPGHRHFTEITPMPDDSFDTIYRNGKLYYSPTLREGFVWWNDYFEIPKPWTVETVTAFKDRIVEENMADVEHSKDCEGCCHYFNCNMGDIKTIMRMLSIKDCLPQIQNRVDLIQYRDNIPEEWRCVRR